VEERRELLPMFIKMS